MTTVGCSVCVARTFISGYDVLGWSQLAPRKGFDLRLAGAGTFAFEGDALRCEKDFLDCAMVLRQLGELPEPAEA